jgi:hypothetical protein
VQLALANLEGDLADPEMLGILYAREPELEVELEVFDEDSWFEQSVDDVEEVPPLRHGILRQALRFLIRRRRDER